MSNWEQYYAASGVKVPDGESTPVRKDFQTLLTSKEQMYLYLEGLKRFQNVDPEDPISWFQIAGIHGLPYQRWPTYEKEIKETGSGTGFCTHSSILFLTWHRPYLALFESVLYAHVQAIAEGIDNLNPEKKTYLSAAKQFRIPYWDWAKKDLQPIPKEALDETYRGPRGPPSKNAISGAKGDYNPLFKAPLPTKPVKGVREDYLRSIKTIGGKPYDSTIRNPDIDQMKVFFKTPGPMLEDVIPVERNLTERTVYILQGYSTFAAVSNNQLRKDDKGVAIPDKENWGSLEDIHNVIHDLSGGGGHMSSIARSAFDPIFWLHHTNIDRLFTVWQAIHEKEKDPNSFVVPRKSRGTFTSKRGVDEDTIATPLYPFKAEAAAESWYTSAATKRTKQFGYEYPETAGLDWSESSEGRAKMAKLIGDYYLPLAKEIQQSILHNKEAGVDFLPQAAVAVEMSKRVPATVEKLASIVKELPSTEQLLATSNKPGKPVLRDLAPNRKYLEWIINIKALKHALDGAYTVHTFLGHPDDETNVALWPQVPTHVGTFVPLGQSNDTGCGKCKEDQEDELEVTGQIPLTVALVERYLAGIIPDLTPANVVPYLQQHLHWRVAMVDGTIVPDQSQVSKLTVFVVTNEVELPEEPDRLPSYAADVTVYPDITTNRDGEGRGHGTGLTAANA